LLIQERSKRMAIENLGDVKLDLYKNLEHIKKGKAVMSDYYELGKIYETIEAFKKARRCFEFAIDHKFYNEDIVIRLGRVLFELREYKAAQDILEQGLIDYSTSIEIMKLMGQVCLEQNNVREALTYLESAQKLDMRNYELNLYIGNAYCRLEEYQNAKEYLLKIEDRQDEGVKHLVFLAIAEINLDEYQSARKHLLKSIRIYPTFEAYEQLGILYSKTVNYKKALMAYEKAASYKINYTDILKKMIDTALLAKQLEKMLSLLEILERMEPDIDGLLHRRGLAYLKMGDNAKALDNFLKELSLDECDYKPWYSFSPMVDRVSLLAHIGVVYLRSGNKNMALHYFEECLKYRPTDKRIEMVYAKAAVLREENGDYEKALKHWNEYLELDEWVKGKEEAILRIGKLKNKIKKAKGGINNGKN